MPLCSRCSSKWHLSSILKNRERPPKGVISLFTNFMSQSPIKFYRLLIVVKVANNYEPTIYNHIFLMAVIRNSANSVSNDRFGFISGRPSGSSRTNDGDLVGETLCCTSTGKSPSQKRKHGVMPFRIQRRVTPCFSVSVYRCAYSTSVAPISPMTTSLETVSSVRLRRVFCLSSGR